MVFCILFMLVSVAPSSCTVNLKDTDIVAAHLDRIRSRGNGINVATFITVVACLLIHVDAISVLIPVAIFAAGA